MLDFKITRIGFLIFICVILPFFDWSEDLVNLADVMYLNIYKICFLLFIVFYAKNLRAIKKYDFVRMALVVTLGLVFMLWHHSFINIKGFFFVLSFFVLFFGNKTSITHGSRGVNLFLKCIIVFLFVFALIEIIIDVKFVTSDFSDNHRDLLGSSLRRASFTFQDPNYLAYHVGLVYLLLKYMCPDNVRGYLIITLLIILFTGSRGALFAFTLALSHKYWMNYLKSKYILAAAIILALFSWSYVSGYQFDKIEEIYLDSSPDTRTIMTRVILYISALVTIYNFPVFGIGHGVVSTYGKSELLPMTLPKDVLEIIDEMGFHNYFLEFAVENGLVFFLVFLYIFKSAYKTKPEIVIFMFGFLCTSGYESPLTFLLLLL